MSGAVVLYPDEQWMRGSDDGVLTWQRLAPDGAIVADGVIERDAVDAVDDVVDGAVVNGTVVTGAVVESTAAHGIPDVAADSDLVVVIPAQLVTELSVTLPPGKKRRLLQALPYLVEDELAAPVEGLHLAIVDESAQGAVQVIAIERRVLENLVEHLGTFGLRPTVVIPDSYLLPVENNDVVVLERGTIVLAKTALGRVCAADTINRDMAMDALLGSGASGALSLINPLDEGRWRIWAADRGIEFVHVQQVDNPLSFLSRQLRGRLPPVNLLQGEFAPPRQMPRAALWRNIAAGVALVAGLQLAYFAVAGWYFEQRATTLEEQVEARYREIFPTDQKIVDIRSQAEGHLRSAAASGNAGFIDQLQTLATAWKVHDPAQITMRGLRYDGRENALTVDVDAASIQRVEQLIAELQKTGTIARLQSARGENAGVRANLVIGGKGG